MPLENSLQQGEATTSVHRLLLLYCCTSWWATFFR